MPSSTSQQVQFTPLAANPSNTAAAATDTARTITLPGASNTVNVLAGVAWSYAGTGTLSGGRLTVSDNGVTVFQIDIQDKGQDKIVFDYPIKGTPGSAMVVTLTAGGANVAGSLNLLGRWTEAAIPGGLWSLNFAFAANSMYL